MDLLPPHERGKMNGFMWGSKLAGISLGGLVFTPVMVRYGLTAGVRLQAVLMLVIMLLPLLIRERPGEKLLPWTAGKRQAPQNASISIPGEVVGLRALAGPLKVAKEVVRAFSLRTTALAAVVALTAVVGEGFHDATTPAVFTQTLGWTAEAYSRVQGIWGIVGKLVGALLGGYLCDRYGRRLISGVAAGLTTVVFVGFALTAELWANDSYPLGLFILLVQGTIAMTSVSLFSLFMKISWTAASATQFTVFMTLLNLGYAAGPFFTRLQLSDSASYLVCGLVSALPILFLPLLRPDEVERRKLAEVEGAAGESAAA
jgi:PAT family beta-lactamase induction signal transducer AmpG